MTCVCFKFPACLTYLQQPLRDWLTKSGLKGKDGVAMPPEIPKDTAERYQEAYRKLTGEADV